MTTFSDDVIDIWNGQPIREFNNDNEFGVLDLQGLRRLPGAKWLVEGVIPASGFIGLYGPPGSYKSFVALDLALSISQGIPWLGKYPVNRAPVVYIAAEGGSGIKMRVHAWMGHHKIDRDVPGFYTRLRPLHVRDEGVVEGFLEFLAEYDIWPGLIVLDTLSRCFSGGEENASDDMAQFVERVTALAHGRHMAALTLHHTNATGQRERGHTSFRGAADTMLKCVAHRSPKGDIRHVVVTNDKQKDAEELPPIYLKPSIYSDAAGNLLSVVMGPIEVTPSIEKDKAKLPAPMRKADMLLVLSAAEDGYTFTEWRLACGVPRSSFARRVAQLLKDGEIEKRESRYYVAISALDIAELEREDD